MKNARQNAILEIILENDIETQNQLIDALTAAGIKSTQATVSRDIKELHIIKELSPAGKYRYATAHKKDVQDQTARLESIFHECLTSCVCAQNIIVIKTLPGLAQAACSAVDGMNLPNIAGTLGGDDTAFLCMYTVEDAKALCEEIKSMM